MFFELSTGGLLVSGRDLSRIKRLHIIAMTPDSSALE